MTMRTANDNEDSSTLPNLSRSLPSGLKVATWNIRSLTPNLDQIKMILNDPKEAHVIGFTETWLQSVTLDSYLTIPGYNIAARRDRSYSTGGGVITYVADSISYDDRPDLIHNDIEATWILLNFPNSSALLICTIYRPPDSVVQWYDHFNDMMDKVYAENKEIILMGDLNIDWLNRRSIGESGARWTCGYVGPPLISLLCLKQFCHD